MNQLKMQFTAILYNRICSSVDLLYLMIVWACVDCACGNFHSTIVFNKSKLTSCAKCGSGWYRSQPKYRSNRVKSLVVHIVSSTVSRSMRASRRVFGGLALLSTAGGVGYYFLADASTQRRMRVQIQGVRRFVRWSRSWDCVMMYDYIIMIIYTYLCLSHSKIILCWSDDLLWLLVDAALFR